MADIKQASVDIKRRCEEVCAQSSIAQRAWDGGYTQGLSERDVHRMIIVAALEALSATQKQLDEAIAIAPPDAIYAKDEKGRRVLVRYIGPTIEELRAARGK